MRNILVFLVCVSIFFIQGTPAGAQSADLRSGQAGRISLSGSTDLRSTDSSGPEKKYGFSVRPHFGFLWGQGEEIVYNPPDSPPNNDSNFLSQLLWDFKPLFYIGADLEYGPRFPAFNNGFVAGLSLKYGLPLNTGAVEDRDWQANGASYLTNYSWHYAFSRGTPWDIFSGLGTFTAELSLGYSWAFPAGFWLRVYGEFSYARFSWTARDGYYQYGEGDPVYTLKPWEPGLPKKPILGPIMHYTQNWIILTPAAALGLRLSENFTLVFLSALTPFSYGYCQDDHLNPQKNTTYLDYLFWGISLKDELDFIFKVNEKLELGVSQAVRYLSGARGDSYSSESGRPYRYDGSTAGGGYLFFEMSITGKYSF